MHPILLFIIAFCLYLRIFLGQLRVIRKHTVNFYCICLTNDTMRGVVGRFVTRNDVILFLVFQGGAGIMMRGGDAPDNGNIY